LPGEGLPGAWKRTGNGKNNPKGKDCGWSGASIPPIARCREDGAPGDCGPVEVENKKRG